MKYIVLSEKKRNSNLVDKLKNEFVNDDFILIDNKNDFNKNYLNEINPKKIFIPHWSYIIKDEIFNAFECIVFHMTDLPYGRGGSPLQNLIIEGKTETRISALKVCEELDAGEIYLKKDLNLNGNAQEIFKRANAIIEKMIIEIINEKIKPKSQEGEVTIFKRRTAKQSNIENLSTIDEVYNYIRMLDAEGYPKAFLENQYFRFEFTNAEVKSDKIISANVRIIKK